MREFYCTDCGSSYRLDIGPVHQYEPTNILCPSCMDELIDRLTAERDVFKKRSGDYWRKLEKTVCFESCQNEARVEDLEAQLLESADLGWHSLRNQRDDLLKRVDELERAVGRGRVLINEHHNIAHGSPLGWGEQCKPCLTLAGEEYRTAIAALKPCDPTE